MVYRLHPTQFYHKYSLKSLTRSREKLVKQLAKNTIGQCNDIFEFQLTSLLTLHSTIQKEIKELENKIEKIIKELDPPTLSIKGIGIISCAGIIAEFGDISRFKSANTMVAFAGLEPSISDSGTESHTGKMVKHGSGHLKYYLLNVAKYVFLTKS